MWNPPPLPEANESFAPSLDALTEQLARRAHEVWGAARVAEGWRWGPERNDQRREHPCLVPFEALPPEEQEYDRRVVHSTLRAILDAGWTLQPPASLGVTPAAVPPLAAIARESFAVLLQSWQARAERAHEWNAHPEVYAVVAKRLISLGHLVLAEQVALEGLSAAGMAPAVELRLRHLLALAAVRFGAPRLAAERLKPIHDDTLLTVASHAGQDDLYVEIRAMQGRVYKDLALMAGSASARRAAFEQSLMRYQEAAAPPATLGVTTSAGFAEINAAATAFWLDRRDEAGRYCKLARQAASMEHARSPHDPWPAATLGECALINGELDEASDWYQLAARLAGDRLGDIASMRRQARLHARHLGVDRTTVDAWLAVPRVVVFTGHMVDLPGRPRPRLPETSLQDVRESLRRWLSEHGAAYAVCGAAAGCDLLFLEEIMARDLPAQVVLPLRRERFLASSVRAAGSDWESRFGRVVTHAAERGLLFEIAGTASSAGGLAFEYGNRLSLGLARLKARELETDVAGLAVWDGEPGLPGGTADTVAWWHTQATDWAAQQTDLPALQVHLLPPPRPRRRTRTAGRAHAEQPVPSVQAAQRHPHRVAGVLFADVVGFSGIEESVVPAFFEVFLGEVGRLIAANPIAPLVRNTWGDGLFLVFSRVDEAGLFALDMTHTLSRIDWTAHGLPAELAVRVGVHAGPLFEFVDRVTGQLTLSGRHVTQAARIEPVTPPGMVYASRDFAALAAAFGVTGFRCEAVGQVPLAKSFGTESLYLLQRTQNHDGEL